MISKGFRKLVINRLGDHLEKSGLFSDFQFDFRSSKSTLDLLTFGFDRITRSFNKSGATLTIALDISKAFNKVSHACIFHKTKTYETSGQLFCLILSFRSNIQLQLVLNRKFL